MKLKVITLDKPVKKFEAKIKKMARQLAIFLPQKGEIELFIISGKKMRMLNHRFLGKNKPTNVLSFPKPKNFPGNKLGEVFLDPVYIKKHKEDLSLMLAHGVLHILGYDHEKRGDRIRMEKKEKQLLSKLIASR